MAKNNSERCAKYRAQLKQNGRFRSSLFWDEGIRTKLTARAKELNCTLSELLFHLNLD